MPLSLFRSSLRSAASALPGRQQRESGSHSASTVRLHLERLDGLALVGWAADADGGSVPLSLVVEGEITEAVFESVHRQDVLDALGLDSDARLGFRVPLPATIWHPGTGRARGLAVVAGDSTAAVTLPESLDAAIVKLRGEATDLSAQAAALLMQHVRHVGKPPDDQNDPWFNHQVRRHGGAEALLALASSAGSVLHGVIELFDAATVQGWAWLEGAADEVITLHDDRGPVECSVIRIERNDVQAALGADRRRLGFEIEVPSTIWDADVDTIELRVCVDGRALTATQPLELSRRLLIEWVEQQRRVMEAPDDSPVVRQERQYRCLLLVEHIAAAGELDTLGDLQRRFILETAERFGIGALFGSAIGQEEARLHVSDGAAPDYATQANWRLMRAFNEAVGRAQVSPLQALQDVLQRHSPSPSARERLLWSVLPYFCGRHQYAVLRPMLDVGRLRKLALSSSAFELSLMLPEAVSSGDLKLAEDAMRRLATATQGWLNTECVHEAVRILFEGGARLLNSVEAIEFLDAFMSFVEALADRGYWSRLQDAHIIAASLLVLRGRCHLPAALAAWNADFIVRRYAVVPDFWRQITEVTPPAAGWGTRIDDAAQAFAAVDRMMRSLESADPTRQLEGLAALARLRAAGNSDAEVIACELLMCRTGEGRAGSVLAAASLLTSGEADRLRLAAHPLTGERADGDANFIQAIRQLAGIPDVPRRPALTCAVGLCLGATESGAALTEDPAVLALCGADSHYVGVRLLCSAWLRLHGSSASMAAAESMLVEVHARWFAAFDDCVHAPHPPAALVASLSLLGAVDPAGAEALRQVVGQMRNAMRGRYGANVLQAEAVACAQPRLGVGSTGHATLVAIYSCVRNLPTRVQAIRDSWAKELSALGIPWVVVVGGGDGRLEGDVLHLDAPDDYESLPAKTLALADWVLRHTRFEHLVKIDDDCHLAARAYFDQVPYLSHHYHGRKLHRVIGATDRIWHQGKSRSVRAAAAADKTPEPSLYADGSSAYVLSRYAMAQLAVALESTVGARLTRSAFLEDKLLGDLLATRGLTVSNDGHYTLIRRRFGPAAQPVNAWDNLFYPSQTSPTLITHLDDHLPMAAVQEGVLRHTLQPARIWPTDAPIRLSGHQTNQLELLSANDRLSVLAAARFLVVAVARNEITLLPHFLALYRRLVATAFVLVDNLSDDGSREYLLDQPDVVLYSADTEYKESHYGVSWQHAVLGAHAVGKWVVLADLDEFLVYPESEQQSLVDWLGAVESEGHDAVRVQMVDMYPAGLLDEADFACAAPFEVAACFDRQPLIEWHLGSGSFSNSPSYLSALRHRLIPDSAPNIYTSQKVAVLKYLPWVRFSEGLHYATNLRVAPEPVWFAHFKYHAGFRRKVQTEVARKQHFNGAEEYQKYAGMLAEARSCLADPDVTERYVDSSTWASCRD
jgi:hypothetical protein